MTAPTVRPVAGALVRGAEVRPGDWVEWLGRYWLCVFPGWLGGPVGTADKALPGDALVRRVTLQPQGKVSGPVADQAAGHYDGVNLRPENRP